MAYRDTDEDSIPRYKRGYEWFSHVANSQLSSKNWRRLGIFSFYDAPFVESGLLYLSPKQAMLTMARMAKKKETGLVLVVDALEKGEMGLSSKAGFDQFMEIFDGLFPDSTKFYFGPRDSDRIWLHGFKTLRIPLKWLTKRPNIFAEVLSDASPVGEFIGPGDAAFEDLEGMIEVLVEKLGPPSLSDEVMNKIRSTEASEYAAEAVGLMTVFVNPTTAVSRGVKYLGKFVSMVKERRKQEVREIYAEWTKRVTEGYSKENLLKFFDDSDNPQTQLVDAVASFKPVLLILETRGTLFDLFLPLILQHLVAEIGFVPKHLRPRRMKEEKPGSREENQWETDSLSFEPIEGVSEEDLPPVTDQLIQTVIGSEVEMNPARVEMSEDPFEGKPQTVLFLDAATHLSKFNKSFKFALNIPERYPNMSVAASFFTDRDKISTSLQEGVLEYMQERALVFDLHPLLFDHVTARMPVSKKAWLLSLLQEMERVRGEGEVAFLEFSVNDDPQWRLHVVEKPRSEALARIRGWFRRSG
ncbi:MAG: hypothetical protein ACTSV3_08265 [Candidatus Thorarchaeota archaeon]|nr:MAG: hypothetical protein DRO87_10840 [Candidatus Thorarchaeota archaeon]RLI56316.1 MAG: hypothetical protein DRP09_06790 [Candidatus Thorarchaeota archaeon]